MDSIKSYRKILFHPLMIDWGWVFAFLVMSVFNGWLLKVAQVNWQLVILFAIFPLFFTFGLFFKNNLALLISLIIPRTLFAVTLCFLIDLSGVQFADFTLFTLLTIALFAINLVFFAFVIFFVARTRGIIAPALIVMLAIFLWIFVSWEVVFDLVWYCNFMITVNKAGRKLRKTFDSFLAAMMTLAGTAGLGISVAWIAASLKL